MDVKSQNYIKIRNSYLNAKCTMVRMRYQKAFPNNNHDFELRKQTKKSLVQKKLLLLENRIEQKYIQRIIAYYYSSKKIKLSKFIGTVS